MTVVLEFKNQTKKYSTLGKLKDCLITRGNNEISKNLCTTTSEIPSQEITQRTSLNGQSSNIKNIAVSKEHTLLLLENGEVYSCGKDTRIGRIGDTTNPLILYPTGISQIAVGVTTSYLLHGNGTFYSFGDNSLGKFNFIHIFRFTWNTTNSDYTLCNKNN
jgi:alpha-tubulin suppressor-like RCC1 family protein